MYKVLVATDGSQTSKKALEYVIKITEALQADVTVISVAQKIPILKGHEGISSTDVAGFEENIKQGMEGMAKEALAVAEKMFQEKRLSVTTRLETGDAANVISDVAEKDGFDHVVIGSRGLGGIKGMVLGSVSNKVVNRVKTNVTVVK